MIRAPSIDDLEPAHCTITLALPPSLNEIWQPVIKRNGKAAMVKRASYGAWRNGAAWEVMAARRGWQAPGGYHLRVTVPESGFDLDNLSAKQIGDALQAGGAVVNDRHTRRMVLEVDATRTERTALVEIWALPDPTPKLRLNPNDQGTAP